MNGRSKPVNKVRRWGSLLRTDTWVLPFFSRYKRVLGLSLLLGVAAAACSSALMFASGYLISASAERPLEGIFALFTPLALVQIFGIGKPFAAYFERLYSHDWVLRMTSELRLRLYRAFESSPSGRGVGEVLGLLAQDVAHIQDLYLRSVFPTVVALVLWVGMALLFGFFTWWFGLAMLLLVGVCVLLVPLVSVLVNGARRLRADNLSAELYASAADDVLGVGDWRCSGRRGDFVGRVMGARRSIQETVEAMERFDRRRDLLVQVLLGAAAAFVALWAAWRFGSPAENPGAYGRPGDWIAAFVLGFFPLIEVFAPVSEAAVRAGGHRAAIERLNALDVQAKAEPPAPVAPGPFRGVSVDGCPIVLSGVRFSYPQGKGEVLRGIDLSVEPGEKVAVLGPSAAGKSTLLGLLHGDLAPTGGTVRLGGLDPASIGAEMPRYVGVIPQETYLFNATLLENLRVASPEASEEQVRAALEAVGLGTLLKRLPQGLQTMVDEAGLRFSGGERHRVALARVLLQDAPVVLLDEPTVGLDPVTEASLLRGVFEVLEGKTVVMVTHHLMGVESMDRIVFIEEGRVVLEGPPARLEATSERYRRLLAMDRGLEHFE